MAKSNVIPTHFAREQMETSRLPRAPAGIADVGAGLEAEAIARFGGAMGKVAGMLAEIQTEKQRGRDNATLAKLSDQERDFVFGAYDILEQYVATDIKEFGNLEEKFAKDWDREIKKLLKDQNRQVSEHFTLWSEQNRAKILQDYHRRIWPKEQSFAQGQAISIADKHLRRGDLKGALATYNQHAQYFPPKTLQALKDKAGGMAIEYQKQALLETIAEAARTTPYKDALYYINVIPKTDITETERSSLIAQRKRQEEIATATTNPKVRWDTLRKLQKDPRTVTDDYLEGLVGKGLTWEDAEEFKKIRDTETDPIKMPRAQLYFNRLDALFDKRDTDADEAYEWDIANQELTDYFKRRPEATAREAKEAYEDITDEKKQGFIKELLDRILWRKGAGATIKETIFGEPEEPEIKTPTKVRVDRKAKVRELVVPLNLKYKTHLQPGLLDNVSDSFFEMWSKLEDGRKLKALQALENGYTEQEILTALGK